MAESYKKTNLIFLLLLGWIIIGFLSFMDNTLAFGCVISSQLIFSFENIGYSTLSLILISLAYFNSNFQWRRTFLIIEVVFWISKLFFIKGGYATGIGGTPNFCVVLYDFLGIILRGILIQHSIPIMMKSRFWILIAASLLLLKIYFFS